MARSRTGTLLTGIAVLSVTLTAAETSPAQEAKAEIPAPAKEEAWDSVFISGVKVGHIHTTVERLSDKGRPLVRVRYDAELSFKRDKDQVNILQQYGTIETPEGAVLKLDTRTLLGRSELRSRGEVVNGQILLSLETGGQQQQAIIPWGPDVRGPYGTELSLSREPIKPGENRTVKIFVPVLNKVCETKLKAVDYEQVPLGGGTKRKLLRVESAVTDSDGKPMAEGNTTYWLDEAGQILKSYTNVFGGQITYRTTRAGAEAKTTAKLDLIKTSILKVASPIPQPTNQRQIVYRITMKDEDPLTFFPTDRRQVPKATSDPHTVILDVHTAGVNDGAPGTEKVDQEFLRPNTMVNSDDPGVVELMRKAVGNEVDPWARAVAIEKWVAKNLTDKNFGVVFANAKQVARDLSGDCTEHSVLTAAMCRAAGIPARAAVGIIYAEHLGGFGFHMWNEVYVNRRWVAIDSAFDESDVDAVHIKFSDTSLDGIAPFETFTSVVRAFDKMKIVPIETRR